MNKGKRILSVKIIREVDTNPDTRYYGEYANRATSEFSIDRAHSEDCASLNPVSDAGHEWLDRIIAAAENQMTVCEEHTTFQDKDCDDCQSEADTSHVIDVCQELQETPDCDCSRNSRWSGREYRYFNPSFNYVDKSGRLFPDNTAEEVRKYVRQDYERMESLNNQQWCYLGIRAEAEIAIPDSRMADHSTIQHVHSGGLWGIESDSDKSHLAEVAQEELSALRTQLKALGFGTRAISTAFKNTEEVDR